MSMNVFITGASSGIGAALAREFASRGATLGLMARRQEALDDLIKTLPNSDRHHSYACDVTDRLKLIELARQFEFLPPAQQKLFSTLAPRDWS